MLCRYHWFTTQAATLYQAPKLTRFDDVWFLLLCETADAVAASHRGPLAGVLHSLLHSYTPAVTAASNLLHSLLVNPDQSGSNSAADFSNGGGFMASVSATESAPLQKALIACAETVLQKLPFSSTTLGSASNSGETVEQQESATQLEGDVTRLNESLYDHESQPHQQQQLDIGQDDPDFAAPVVEAESIQQGVLLAALVTRVTRLGKTLSDVAKQDSAGMSAHSTGAPKLEAALSRNVTGMKVRHIS